MLTLEQPAWSNLNNLAQATENGIHLIHPIIDFFILTWACWCHRSTWPYQMWWCSFCLFNAKGSSSNRNGMVNLSSWDRLRDVVSFVFLHNFDLDGYPKMQMNCSIQHTYNRTGPTTNRDDESSQQWFLKSGARDNSWPTKCTSLKSCSIYLEHGHQTGLCSRFLYLLFFINRGVCLHQSANFSHRKHLSLAFLHRHLDYHLNLSMSL